jgi:predicted extracellular nuclease
MRCLLVLSLCSALTACAAADTDRIPPPQGNGGDDEVDGGIDGGDGTGIDAQEQPLSLFFSEILDHPTNGNVKYVEIYNPTSEPISLEGWSLRRYANGTTVAGEYDFTADATIASEQALVVTGSGTEFQSTYGMAADLVAAVVVNGNGDDVYELFDGTGVVDVYGTVGVDGTGQPWEYTKKSAQRVAGVTAGVTTWNAVGWLIAEGTGTPKIR